MCLNTPALPPPLFITRPARSAGPGDGDLSTTAYVYTSSVDPVAHPQAGLVGVLVVGARGSLLRRPRGEGRAEAVAPAGVDALEPLLFTIVNENASPYLLANAAAAGVAAEALDTPEFEESNLIHSINGLVFCNGAGLQVCAPCGGVCTLVQPAWHV